MAQDPQEKDIYEIFHRYSDEVSGVMVAGTILIVVSLTAAAFGWFSRE